MIKAITDRKGGEETRVRPFEGLMSMMDKETSNHGGETVEVSVVLQEDVYELIREAETGWNFEESRP